LYPLAAGRRSAVQGCGSGPIVAVVPGESNEAGRVMPGRLLAESS
jgi:hypothetical protein